MGMHKNITYTARVVEIVLNELDENGELTGESGSVDWDWDEEFTFSTLQEFQQEIAKISGQPAGEIKVEPHDEGGDGIVRVSYPSNGEAVYHAKPDTLLTNYICDIHVRVHKGASHEELCDMFA